MNEKMIKNINEFLFHYERIRQEELKTNNTLMLTFIYEYLLQPTKDIEILKRLVSEDCHFFEKGMSLEDAHLYIQGLGRVNTTVTRRMNLRRNGCSLSCYLMNEVVELTFTFEHTKTSRELKLTLPDQMNYYFVFKFKYGKICGIKHPSNFVFDQEELTKTL